ncbi:MAG: N-methyl-L-tryptophan oxidase [Thermomicrobiales bacterium]
MTTYDVIVAGGGTMGTAAAWALAKHGLKPVVLEQFHHVHDKGAHGGETRIIRHAYAESADYVPLVRRADQLWLELEDIINQQVLVRTGGLELSAPGFDHAHAARRAADEYGLPYEWLTPAEANARWAGLTVPEDWCVMHSPNSGFLLTESALRGMADAAKRLGATFVEHAPVTAWGADSQSTWVETPVGGFDGEALIVTAGAWSGRVLAELGLPLEIRRKTLWWQELADPEPYRPDRFPVFISDSSHGEIYGFPVHGVPALKIANHSGGEPVDPDTVDRATHPGENAPCLSLAAELLPGVRSEVVKSAVCLYAVTPDHDFIVDRHPEFSRVVLGAGFSGHGFKFAPAIGEVLANLALEADFSPVPRLALGRFSPAVA